MNGLTKKQEEVLKIIKNKPDITYQGIADILGCTKQNAYFHCRQLAKKGYIQHTRYKVFDKV